MEYFALLYRFKTEDRYLIWISNEKDSVEVDTNGKIPVFKEIAALREYAGRNHYTLQREEPTLHDLDWVAAWTKEPTVRVDCKAALAAWNLFTDVAYSVPAHGEHFERVDSQPAIYNKLFWGNNLPSLTPENKRFVPEWSPDEVAVLAKILRVGLNLFESCTRNSSWDS